MAMTNFSVPLYGFKFVNDFVNDFVPAVDWHTSGLCGGMSYASLDYYYSKIPAPTQPFRPANGTPLHTYLYDRQVTSIESNIDKWVEIGFNPLGARNTEFFNWGLSAKKGERIDELKEFIDKGHPVVLGMQGDGDTDNHQVIAIGYDMGRYKGDLGAFKEDFKIFICDPNHPGRVMTLVPDLAKQVFCYGPGTETWRTYFVDKNYHARQPPKLAGTSYPHDGRAHELALSFTTGGDDLRGGNDNVDLVVNVADGSQQVHRNINQGGRWIPKYTETAEVVLQPAVARSDIRSLVVSTTFHGGIGGDNWDMSRLVVRALIDGAYDVVAVAGAKRFTGEDKTLTVPVSAVVAAPGQISRLAFTFATAGDDLRGVNDNLNLVIHFRDGHVQRVDNANGGHRWPNDSTHEVDVALNEAVAPTDVTRIVLETTFGGGIGGDNWNMGSVSIRALGNGVDEVLATHGFKRFTGSDKTLVIPLVAAAPSQASRLSVSIRTGGDDLRGGNDNLNLTVRCRDGHVQSIPNVNGGARWGNDSTHVVALDLDHAVKPEDIVELDMQTTFHGGIGGDNWNMDWVVVTALGPGVSQQIFNHGAKRFTGSDGTLKLVRA